MREGRGWREVGRGREGGRGRRDGRGWREGGRDEGGREG